MSDLVITTQALYQVVDDEYHSGYDQGYEEGYEDGKQDGWDEGHREGYEDGQIELLHTPYWQRPREETPENVVLETAESVQADQEFVDTKST
jgi:flagellar biosynthesis/type III secretory pathway protein FliH